MSHSICFSNILPTILHVFCTSVVVSILVVDTQAALPNSESLNMQLYVVASHLCESGWLLLMNYVLQYVVESHLCESGLVLMNFICNLLSKRVPQPTATTHKALNHPDKFCA